MRCETGRARCCHGIHRCRGGRTCPGSSERYSACHADVRATRPHVPMRGTPKACLTKPTRMMGAAQFWGDFGKLLEPAALSRDDHAHTHPPYVMRGETPREWASPTTPSSAINALARGGFDARRPSDTRGHDHGQDRTGDVQRLGCHQSHQTTRAQARQNARTAQFDERRPVAGPCVVHTRRPRPSPIPRLPCGVKRHALGNS